MCQEQGATGRSEALLLSRTDKGRSRRLGLVTATGGGRLARPRPTVAIRAGVSFRVVSVGSSGRLRTSERLTRSRRRQASRAAEGSCSGGRIAPIRNGCPRLWQLSRSTLGRATDRLAGLSDTTRASTESQVAPGLLGVLSTSPAPASVCRRGPLTSLLRLIGLPVLATGRAAIRSSR